MEFNLLFKKKVEKCLNKMQLSPFTYQAKIDEIYEIQGALHTAG